MEKIENFIKKIVFASAIFLSATELVEAQKSGYFPDKHAISLEESKTIEQKIHTIDSLSNVLISKYHGQTLSYEDLKSAGATPVYNVTKDGKRLVIYEHQYKQSQHDSTGVKTGEVILQDTKSIFTREKKYQIANFWNSQTQDYVLIENYNGPIPPKTCLSVNNPKIVYYPSLAPTDYKHEALNHKNRVEAHTYTVEDLEKGLDDLARDVQQEIDNLEK